MRSDSIKKATRDWFFSGSRDNMFLIWLLCFKSK